MLSSTDGVTVVARDDSVRAVACAGHTRGRCQNQAKSVDQRRKHTCTVKRKGEGLNIRIAETESARAAKTASLENMVGVA